MRRAAIALALVIALACAGCLRAVDLTPSHDGGVADGNGSGSGTDDGGGSGFPDALDFPDAGLTHD